MSERRISWGHLVGALLCLVPVAVGVAVVLSRPAGAGLGWALIGFFGAGAVVLGRQALTAHPR